MLDLSLPGSAATLYAQTSSSGRHVDVLVNNAGFGDYGDFTETDVQKNHDMLQVNIVTFEYCGYREPLVRTCEPPNADD